VVAAAGNALGAAAFGGDGAWDLSIAEIGQLALALVIAVLAGLAFGMLFLNASAAISLHFALPLIIWPILGGLLDPVRRAGEWLDLSQTTAPLFDHGIAGDGWAKLGVSVAVWVVLPMVIGAWRVRTTEIRSA